MLYLQSNTSADSILRNPSGTFDSLYDKSWFEDNMVRRIAEGVDSVKLVMDDIFEHEVFGRFLATKLSGGAKILILAYRGELSNKVYPLSWLGDNCYKWLFEIEDKTNIVWDADCMIPPDVDELCLTVKDTGERIATGLDYWHYYLKNVDW